MQFPQNDPDVAEQLSAMFFVLKTITAGAAPETIHGENYVQVPSQQMLSCFLSLLQNPGDSHYSDVWSNVKPLVLLPVKEAVF